MAVEIKLTRGCTTIIDNEDGDLADHKWYAKKSGVDSLYASRRVDKNGTFARLHRVIAGRMVGHTLSITEIVDHINHDTLDNRRSNLRVGTSSNNSSNTRLSHRNTSGYKGVSWSKYSKKWTAKIVSKGKKYHLGYFTDPVVAHEAYLAAARVLFGEFMPPEHKMRRDQRPALTPDFSPLPSTKAA